MCLGTTRYVGEAGRAKSFLKNGRGCDVKKSNCREGVRLSEVLQDIV